MYDFDGWQRLFFFCPIPDWSNWPVADDAEIDAMIDAYKKDTGLTETRPPEIKVRLIIIRG